MTLHQRRFDADNFLATLGHLGKKTMHVVLYRLESKTL